VEITEVRIKLVSNPNDKLRAFCSLTFDQEYVVRDLKIIEGSQGLFVAMPSRKLCDRCPPLRREEPPARPLLQRLRHEARPRPRAARLPGP
jgi:hypothetical protein